MEKGKPGEIYNVCSGKAIEIKDILAEIIKISGKKIKVEKDPKLFRKSDLKKNYCDSSKIKKLGWKPKYSVKQTLRDVYNFYLNSK